MPVPGSRDGMPRVSRDGCYSGNSYSGTSKMTMNHGGQAQNLTMHYSGRRIGECRK
jgi:hypothetical protein